MNQNKIIVKIYFTEPAFFRNLISVNDDSASRFLSVSAERSEKLSGSVTFRISPTGNAVKFIFRKSVIPRQAVLMLK